MTKKQVEAMARASGKSNYMIMCEQLAKRPKTLSDLRKVYAKHDMVLRETGSGYEVQDVHDGHTIEDLAELQIVDLIEIADNWGEEWDSTGFDVEDR